MDKQNVSSKSRLNAVFEDHFSETFESPDSITDVKKVVKKLRKAVRAVSGEESSKMLKYLRDSAERMLKGNAERTKDLPFLRSVVDLFGNFKDIDNLPLFPSDEVAFEACETLDSHLKISPTTFIVYLKIPQSFFYKSDLVNFRIVQKLNFALSIVAFLLQRSEAFESPDAFQLNSCCNEDGSSSFLFSLFDFCYLKISHELMKLHLKCVISNEDLFDLERLTLEKKLLRLTYLGGDKQDVSSSSYNQKIINSFLEEELHKLLLSELQQMPLGNKVCVKMFSTWTVRCGIEKLINLSLITSIMIHLTQSGEIKRYSDTGGLYKLFYKFSLCFINLLSPSLPKLSLDPNSKKDSSRMSFMCPLLSKYDFFVNFTSDHGRLMRYHLESLNETLKNIDRRHHLKELFVRPTNCLNHFDFFMQVTVDSLGVLEAAEPTDKLLSCCNVVNYVISKCCCKLRQALGSRSSLVVPLCCLPVSSNNTNGECERRASSVVFGVKLAFSYQREAVIRGPNPQDTAEVAAAFQALWGSDQCKLRRFKDGTVCYAVTFAQFTGSHMQLRKVCGAIARLVVCEHLGRSGDVLSTCEVSSMFDTVMVDALGKQADKDGEKEKEKESTGEEEVQSAINCVADFESLMMRMSSKLPLAIKSIVSLEDGLCRNTSVLSPKAAHPKSTNEAWTWVQHGKVRMPKRLLRPGGQNVLPVRMQVVLESHSQWPSSDVTAVNYLKASFYFKMQELIDATKTCGAITCVPTESCLYVLHERVLFVVTVFHPPEVQLLQRGLRNQKGAPLKLHSVASAARELQHVHKPQLRAMLQGFEQFFPQFGAICRHVKLWVDCQLLLFHLGHLAVELLVAAVLENSLSAGRVVNSAQSGLVEFWSFVSSFDFSRNPLFVYLDDPSQRRAAAAASADKTEGGGGGGEGPEDTTRKKFDFDRSLFPALSVFTRVSSFDQPLFTSHVDNSILKRLVRLSSVAFCTLSQVFPRSLLSGGNENHLLNLTVRKLFAINFDAFDIVIRLHRGEEHEEEDEEVSAKKSKFSGSVALSSETVIPIFGLQPALCVADRINTKMGHLFLVFVPTLNPNANTIALKFRSDMQPQVKQWAQRELETVISELRNLIGSDIIETMLVRREQIKL